MAPLLPACMLAAVASLAIAQSTSAFVETLVENDGQIFRGFTESGCTGAIELDQNAPFEFGASGNQTVVQLFENVASEEHVVDCDPTQPFRCESRTVQNEVEIHYSADFTGAPGLLTSAAFGASIVDVGFGPSAVNAQLVVDNGVILPTTLPLVPIGPSGSFDFVYQGAFPVPVFVDGPVSLTVIVAGRVMPEIAEALQPSDCPNGEPPTLVGSGATQLVFQNPVLALAGDAVGTGVPVAQLAVEADPHACGQPVLLDASGSSHTDPARSLVAFEWDLDGDGAFDDATGPMTSALFTEFGTHAVAVRVTDDGVPPQQDTAQQILLAENRAPVADAGGPYDIAPTDTLFLDASGSSDPNSLCGDTIEDYEWHLNADDIPDASGPAPAIPPDVRLGLMIDANGNLRVVTRDFLGLEGEDTAPLRIGDPPDAPNVSIEKRPDSGFEVGQTGLYRVSVTNVGGEPVVGTISVTDTLPTGLTYVEASGSGWSCPSAPAGPEIVCTRPGLGPGETSSFLLIVMIDDDVAEQVTNVASVVAPGDAIPSDNEASADTEILFPPDLQIEKTAEGPFVVGTAGVYTLRITNVGRGAFQGTVDVVDQLPAGLLFLGAASDRFVCTLAAPGIVGCTAQVTSGLGPGESSEIRITVNVTGEPGLVINLATLQVVDADASNNGPVDVTTEVVAEPFEVPPECGVPALAGWLAPAQGVWQDDEQFADQPTKRLTRVTPVIYEAELDMVQDRSTLLFGIVRAIGESADEQVDRRNRIVVRGIGTGSTTPVRPRFVLEQGGRREILYVGKRTAVPLDEPCGPPQEFEVVVDASDGVPPKPLPPFQFDETGPYRLSVELVRDDGSSTGLRVSVVGEVVDPAPLQVHLVPGSFVPPTPAERSRLQELTAKLADLSQRRLPDYLPVAPGEIEIVSHPVQDFSDIITGVDTKPIPGLQDIVRHRAIREELTRQMQAGGFLAGADRIVVLLAVADYVLVEPLPSAGFAPAEKIVFVRDGGAFPSTVDTVAHEIVHTLPYAWSGPPEGEDPDPDNPSSMAIDCLQDWHNLDIPVAYGHRIRRHGIENRRRFNGVDGIMSSAGGETWIGQCTYWHVLDELLQGPDPELLLVQGRIRRSPTQPFGQLLPFYETLGTAFREASPDGDWAVVLRDAAGASLGRHPLRPVFDVPDVADGARDFTSFSFRVPRLAETARVELVGPPGDALLDVVDLSASPPDVEITAPAEGSVVSAPDGVVEVSWVASDPDADAPLLASVFTSDDAGVTWRLTAFELEGGAAQVPVSARRLGHRVRVVVTDGGRSGEAEVGFELDLAPEADLSVASSARPLPARAGRELEIALEVRNQGPTDATGVVLIASLPETSMFAAATVGCANADGVVTCAIGDLAAGRIAVREVIVLVAPGSSEPVVSTATVAGAEPDPQPANDSSVLTVTLADFGDCPDVGIADSADVSRRAVVADSARICDGARVLADAVIGAGAVVGENVRVARSARVEADAALERGASLGRDARLGAAAFLGSDAQVDRGAQVGDAAQLGAGARLGRDARLGDAATLASGASIGRDFTSGIELVLGADARIDRDVSVGDRLTLGADARVGASCELGRNVRVGDGASLGRGVRTGDDVSIGNRAHIGRDARLGEGSLLGDDVVVERGAAVPPGSVLADGAVFP